MVWGAGLATASSVAILRVAAGKHYPSDVVMGAAMGSFIGWLVPMLHREREQKQTALVVTPGYVGLLRRF